MQVPLPEHCAMLGPARGQVMYSGTAHIALISYLRPVGRSGFMLDRDTFQV